MMKILLPIDGTELSIHETRFAMRLVANGLRAHFVLANVQEPASFYELVTAGDNPSLIESAARAAGRDLMAESARLLREADIPFDTAVITGDPATAVRELVAIHDCAMVIMGQRALGPLRRLLESSTSRRLLADTPVPVLLVKPPQDSDPESA